MRGWMLTGYGTCSKVRVWDTLGEEQILKGEYKVISGKMRVLPPVS